jgi:hypothetical protein
VPPVQELTRAFRSGERTSPKTVLGFLAIMTSILASAAVLVAWLCSGSSSLHYLIPIILIIFIVIFIAIVVVVLVISWKDPSKLMLGQITGREYVAIQRLTLGDSNAGEHIDSLVVEAEVIEAGDIGIEQTDPPKLSRSSGDGRDN